MTQILIYRTVYSSAEPSKGFLVRSRSDQNFSHKIGLQNRLPDFCITDHSFSTYAKFPEKLTFLTP